MKTVKLLEWDTEFFGFPVAQIQSRTINEMDLKLHCKSLLAGFKVPKYYKITDLPKTSTGKIQKFILREKADGLN